MAFELVTGKKGTPHVTSTHDKALNRGLYGPDSYVLDVGNKFAHEIISNNLIRIKDGWLLQQGALAGMVSGDHQDLTIDNGLAGVNRNDLIVASYRLDVTTGHESTTLEVIKGTPGTTAADPTFTAGSISEGATLVQTPLRRVKLTGLNISAVEDMAYYAVNIKTLHYAMGSLWNSGIANKAGDLRLYDGLLYKCKAATTAGAAWDATKWDQTSLLAMQERDNKRGFGVTLVSGFNTGNAWVTKTLPAGYKISDFSMIGIVVYDTKMCLTTALLHANVFQTTSTAVPLGAKCVQDATGFGLLAWSSDTAVQLYLVGGNHIDIIGIY